MRRCRRSWSTPSRARWTPCSTPRRARGSTRSATSSCMKARAGCPTRWSRPTSPTPSPSSGRPTSTPSASPARRRCGRSINVEGNFLRNVDYEACFARGIHVLVASPAFAPAVAEAALGMAIDLARGITAADRAMRAGTEAYGLEANRGSFLLAGSDVGVVGLGDLGRELVRLLAPFRCRVRAHDPWLPELAVRAAGAEPSGLDELLRASRVVFVFAAPTTDNQAMLGRRELELLPDGRRGAGHEPRRGGRPRRARRARRRRAPARRRRRVAARAGPAPTTPPAPSRACCSRPIAPAACPRPSRPSAASWWPTSSSSCAGCRRSRAGAPSARPWRGCAAVPSTSLSELRGTPRPGGLPLAQRPAVAVGQPAQRALPGALAHRLERLLREALALQRRGRAARRPRRPARCASGGHRRPVTPSSTIEHGPPSATATTGSPLACASSRTCPKVSVRLAKRKRSALA